MTITSGHPSSETQGQSVGSGERARRKFSWTGERAPEYRLSPNYFQKFKRMPVPDWAQKILCIIVPNRRTVFPEFFSWVHTRRLLFQSRVVPIKILSARKIKTLFQKYKLELTTGIHACIGHVLRIYSGIFKRYNDRWQPRNHRTEKGIHIFLVSISICQGKRTLLEMNFYQHFQVHEENEFCHCLFTSFTKHEIRHCHG